jgi:hypothetical protein
VISIGRGGRRTAPCAFTEQGVAMLSPVLGSSRAIVINIEIMRTFVRVRALAATHQDLAKRLSKLEETTERLAMQQGHLQPQHPCATHTGVRCATRADDATRAAQAAHRVRHTGRT